MPSRLKKKSSAAKLQDTKDLLDQQPELIGDNQGNFRDHLQQLEGHLKSAPGGFIGAFKGFSNPGYAQTRRDIDASADKLYERVQSSSDELRAHQAYQARVAQNPSPGDARGSLDSSGASVMPHFAEYPTPRDSYDSAGYRHYAASVESRRYSADFMEGQVATQSATQPYRRATTHTMPSSSSQHSSHSGRSATSANQHAMYGQSRNPVASPTFGQPANRTSHASDSASSEGTYIGGRPLSHFVADASAGALHVPVTWSTGSRLAQVFTDANGQLACWVGDAPGRGQWYAVTYRA